MIKISRLSMRSKLLIAFLLGIVWFIALRFVLWQPEITHYHANFGVFINGERVPFDSPLYYEEISLCGSDANDPAARVHMHDLVNHIVHVHDEAVTWGHFFEVLGLGLTDRSFSYQNEVYTEESTDITFILNGQPVRQIAGRVIGDTDRLLINVGEASEAQLQERFEALESDAAVYNERTDPSACSGDDNPTLLNRLRHAVWFGN